MTEVHFHVHGKPEPAGSKKAYVVNGRALVTDANPRAKSWKQEVVRAALEATNVPINPVFHTGAVFLRMRFTLRRPKAHYRADGSLRADAPEFHTLRPDALKLARGTEDALTGIVYRDDSQTVVVSWKVYGEVEGVEVWASPIPPIPAVLS